MPSDDSFGTAITQSDTGFYIMAVTTLWVILATAIKEAVGSTLLLEASVVTAALVFTGGVVLFIRGDGDAEAVSRGTGTKRQQNER